MPVRTKVAALMGVLAAVLSTAKASAGDFAFGFHYERGGYCDVDPGYVVYDRTVYVERPVYYQSCAEPVVVVRDYCPPPRVVYRSGYYRHGGYYRYGGYHRAPRYYQHGGCYYSGPRYYRGGRSFGGGFYYRD